MTWRTTHSVVTGVDFNKHLNRLATSDTDLTEARSNLERIQAHEYPSLLTQRLKSGKLLLSVDWIGNQDVVKSSGHHHFGFADFGAREARRTCLHLESRDLGHLVGLCVRPQSNTGVASALGHFGNVVFHHVEIDDERGRVEVERVHGCNRALTGVDCPFIKAKKISAPCTSGYVVDQLRLRRGASSIASTNSSSL